MNKQLSDLKPLAKLLRDTADKIDAACDAVAHLEMMGISFGANGVSLPDATKPAYTPSARRIIGVDHIIPKSSGKTTLHDAAYSILADTGKPILLEFLAKSVGEKLGKQVGPDSLRSVLSRTKDSTDKRIYAPMGEGKWGLAQWKPDGADLFTSTKKT